MLHHPLAQLRLRLAEAAVGDVVRRPQAVRAVLGAENVVELGTVAGPEPGLAAVPPRDDVELHAVIATEAGTTARPVARAPTRWPWTRLEVRELADPSAPPRPHGVPHEPAAGADDVGVRIRLDESRRRHGVCGQRVLPQDALGVAAPSGPHLAFIALRRAGVLVWRHEAQRWRGCIEGSGAVLACEGHHDLFRVDLAPAPQLLCWQRQDCRVGEVAAEVWSLGGVGHPLVRPLHVLGGDAAKVRQARRSVGRKDLPCDVAALLDTHGAPPARRRASEARPAEQAGAPEEAPGGRSHAERADGVAAAALAEERDAAGVAAKGRRVPLQPLQGDDVVVDAVHAPGAWPGRVVAHGEAEGP
mmetsp:Transcript_47376/g.95628  ORF Transcript_47376/g.95628 Transcript_47376/m.95628 type:complete len:359 (+) Transcript_47376:312-1388(+)